MSNLEPSFQKLKILFVCIGNSCRSQMAEGFARTLGQDKIQVYSAGSRPLGKVDTKAIQAMRDIGIDISTQYSKGLEEVPSESYAAVVTMGCGDACPAIPAKKHLDWQIPDPYGGPQDQFIVVRDLIQKKVRELLKNL